MGRSSSGRHLLELGSFKDSRRRLFFSMKSVACKKKRLPAIKSVCLQKKAFACNKKHLPAILFCASIFFGSGASRFFPVHLRLYDYLTRHDSFIIYIYMKKAFLTVKCL
jgi:hypothetical protein